MDPASITSLLMQCGFGGLLAWYLWLDKDRRKSERITLEKTTALDAEARKEAANIEAASRERIAEKTEKQLLFLVNSFEHQMKYERESCTNQFSELLERMERNHQEVMRALTFNGSKSRAD